MWEVNERNRIWQEIAMLRTLKQVGLAVPAVEFTEENVVHKREDNYTKCISGWLFFITPRVPGIPLNETIGIHANWIRSVWERAGRFAAELGQVPPITLSVSSRTADNPAIPLKRLNQAEPYLSTMDCYTLRFHVIGWADVDTGTPMETLASIIGATPCVSQ